MNKEKFVCPDCGREVEAFYCYNCGADVYFSEALKSYKSQLEEKIKELNDNDLYVYELELFERNYSRKPTDYDKTMIREAWEDIDDNLDIIIKFLIKKLLGDE